MTAPVPATAVELREAQRIEYSTYVALVPIDIGGARAFNVGDPVPVSHVENGSSASRGRQADDQGRQGSGRRHGAAEVLAARRRSRRRA
jgi:hypothetical protein